MREAPTEAQAREATALVEPARAVGLRLTKRGAGELGYTPRVQWPFVIMLYHKLGGERMTVKFEPGGEGGTRVTISGKVAGSNHMLAEDQSTGLKLSGPRPLCELGPIHQLPVWRPRASQAPALEIPRNLLDPDAAHRQQRARQPSSPKRLDEPPANRPSSRPQALARRSPP